MRGKARFTGISESATRITPAYAGKRAVGSYQLRVSGDHPRVCGEKYLPKIYYNEDVGSPPRMRGKV